MVTVDFIRKDNPMFDEEHVQLRVELTEDDYEVTGQLGGSFDIVADETCYVSHQNEFERLVGPDDPVKDVEFIQGLKVVVAKEDADFPDWDEL